MEYKSLDANVSRRLGNAQVVHSDTWISLRSEIGPELRLSRVEFERLVENAPSFWFETIDIE